MLNLKRDAFDLIVLFMSMAMTLILQRVSQCGQEQPGTKHSTYGLYLRGKLNVGNYLGSPTRAFLPPVCIHCRLDISHPC